MYKIDILRFIIIYMVKFNPLCVWRAVASVTFAQIVLVKEYLIYRTLKVSVKYSLLVEHMASPVSQGVVCTELTATKYVMFRSSR